MLTGTVYPITGEAPEAGAKVIAHGVHTAGKLTARVPPCFTLIHIYRGIEGESDGGGERVMI